MLPVANIFPSGEKATTKTQLVWPLSVRNGVPVSQSHIRAVLSPLPVTIVADDAGENVAARIASPCPDIDAEHRDTALTLKIACGVYCSVTVSSVVLKPGFRTEA